MRTISPELADRLEGGATTLAHVLRIVRRDSAAFAFTDHDRPMVFDTLTCEPNTSLQVGALEKSAGLDVDSASVAGALSSEAISEEDLARGVWDGAVVDLFRVDWTDPSLRVHLFSGRVGEVRRSVASFEAELRGTQAALNVPIGRVFSRYCDADLGDGRCGVDLETSALRGEGEVEQVLGSHLFKASGLSSFTDGWFARGKVTWAIGGESEVASHRLDADGAVIELLEAPGAALAVDASFTIYAGCDKTFATCRAKFMNHLNFRGFPHMPGNDLVQAGPRADTVFDGGSRQS